MAAQTGTSCVPGPQPQIGGCQTDFALCISKVQGGAHRVMAPPLVLVLAARDHQDDRDQQERYKK